jgi:cytochrome c-type biogenesis protein CcmF
VNFLMIVSPLVTWIWLGALIIAFGGLIALWPVPAFARRRAVARAGAGRRAPAVAARETA